MAERSFAREVQDLKLGEGEEFRGEGLTTREIEHVLKLPNRPLRGGTQRARLYALVHS